MTEKIPPEQDEAEEPKETINILSQIKARIFKGEKLETERERIAFFQRLGKRYRLRQREKAKGRAGQSNPRQQAIQDGNFPESE
ncbi:MAG: hypothetical protein ACUVV0_11930 [Anaerolineae bacterium]